jgi:hypothetical protein
VFAMCMVSRRGCGMHVLRVMLPAGMLSKDSLLVM